MCLYYLWACVHVCVLCAHVFVLCECVCMCVCACVCFVWVCVCVVACVLPSTVYSVWEVRAAKLTKQMAGVVKNVWNQLNKQIKVLWWLWPLLCCWHGGCTPDACLVQTENNNRIFIRSSKYLLTYHYSFQTKYFFEIYLATVVSLMGCKICSKYLVFMCYLQNEQQNNEPYHHVYHTNYFIFLLGISLTFPLWDSLWYCSWGFIDL